MTLRPRGRLRQLPNSLCLWFLSTGSFQAQAWPPEACLRFTEVMYFKDFLTEWGTLQS